MMGSRVASEIFIPLTVGGGVRTLEDFDRVLKCVIQGPAQDGGPDPHALQPPQLFQRAHAAGGGNLQALDLGQRTPAPRPGRSWTPGPGISTSWTWTEPGTALRRT